MRLFCKTEVIFLKTCIIFGAAGFDGLLCPIPENALTVAADGGLRHTQALGRHRLHAGGTAGP